MTVSRQSKPVQTLLTECNSALETQKQFNKDLCYAMVSSNIPLNKLQSLPFKSFLQKYIKLTIPDESTLRKNYLLPCYEMTISKIREQIGNCFVYIMVDETTDSRGLYICNLIIGILHPEKDPTPFLISSKVLEKTNFETVSRLVNNSLTDFFKDSPAPFQDKVLLLVTDAAPYMLKAGVTLKVFFPNMIHVTCLAHGLNRVAEKVRDIFPEVNKLLNNGKKIFLKAPQRVTAYKEYMQCQLPPEPVITRWGTWLEAALFYAENLTKLRQFILTIPEDAQSITKVKNILTTTKINTDLAFIYSHLSCLPLAISQLETKNLTLKSQIDIVEKVGDELKKIENDNGQLLIDKFTTVLKKNPGYDELKKYNLTINGEDIGLDAQPDIISCYKKCPITSVSVERSFSQLKHILSDRRHNFSDKNFEMYLVVNFNSQT